MPPDTAPDSNEASRPSGLTAPAGEPGQLSPAPITVVGRSPGLPLHRVKNAVFFRDGVAIAHSAEVLFLDERGRLVWRQGQEGEGPGDYKSLFGLSRYGDGLLAWDIGLSRLTALDASGAVLRTVRIDPGGFFTTLVGTFGNSALVRHRTMGYPGEGERDPAEIRLPMVFEIYDLGDGTLKWRGSLPGEEEWVARTADRVHGGLPVLFGRTAIAAVTPERAYIATTDSLVFATVDANGHEGELSLPSDPVPVRAAWAAAVRDSLRAAIEASRSGRMTEFRRRLMDGLPVRSTLPAFADALGGADGRLWVQAYPNPLDAHVVWVALDPDGRPEQAIEVPRGARVLDLDGDRVLLLSKDLLGVERVEVFALVP